MKKLFSIILALCLMASLCITAFAEEISALEKFEGKELNPSDVITLSGEKGEDDVELIGVYGNFAEGWSAAMGYATSDDFMGENGYRRIIIDFHADWKATNGSFGKGGAGFLREWGVLYVPDDVAVTINLNGHTINRGLTEYREDGEVMYVEGGADLIINNGTITGGFSCNGAGGINIDDRSRVTLNNVNIIGNKVEDDDGAGIAVYNNSTLTVNGGSISNNVLYNSTGFTNMLGGGIFASESDVYLDGVTFENNHGDTYCDSGIAVFMDEGNLTMDNCIVTSNGNDDDIPGKSGQMTVIHGRSGANLRITNTVFIGNGNFTEDIGQTPSAIIRLRDYSYLYMDNVTFTENLSLVLLGIYDSNFDISNCDFTNNGSSVAHATAEDHGYFTNCKFDGSLPDTGDQEYTFKSYLLGKTNFTFVDCDLTEVTFKNLDETIEFKNCVVPSGLQGSLFEESSATMLFALAALAASVASVALCLSLNKKISSLKNGN